MENKTKNLIEKGFDYLSSTQNKEGFFLSYTSGSKNFSKYEVKESIFPSCLILSSLNTLENFDKKNTREKLFNFLLSQKNNFHSFNYWTKDSKDSKELPYPDDIDTIFCALSAMVAFKPRFLTGKVLADIVTILSATEHKEGGPYYTWITPDNAKDWKDIDLAVNSNTAYFLSLQNIYLKNINILIEKAIDEKKFHSPYYASEFSIIYFISRFYKGKKKSEIINYLLSKKSKNGSWGNPFDTSLAVSSLINFGYKKENLNDSLNYLVNIKWDKVIKSYPFVIERSRKKNMQYMGSPALTVAFYIEALNKFIEFKTKNPKKSSGSKTNRIHLQILNNATENFSKFEKGTQNNFKCICERTIKNDSKKQITLLPYFFKAALGEKGSSIKDEDLKRLGLINLYGWIAYSIYDDFYDGQGNAEFLPIANLCLRQLVYELDHFSNACDFIKLHREILDKIDQANEWEVLNCRAKVLNNKLLLPKVLPDYKDLSNLADRSMGHAIGPIAIMRLLGYKKDSQEMRNLILFFKNYIIGRQLNDDAHDWIEDLKNGNLTFAVVLLTKELKSKEIDLDDLEYLQTVFYQKIIPKICKEILSRTRSASQALSKIKCIENKEILNDLVLNIEGIANKTLQEQKEMLEFLKAYK